MLSNHAEKPNERKNKKFKSNLMLSQKNIIAVYTVLRILIKMKESLGLEAMLEYMQAFLRLIEMNNYAFRDDVTKVIELINVRNIYEEAVRK